MKKQTLLLPLFMVFCLQLTHAQILLSDSEVDSYVESHYNNILFSSIVYGSDDGDDGCWNGAISRASLADFVTFASNDSVLTENFNILMWVPNPDDSGIGYLYNSGSFCEYDGNNLGYDGMTIYQINWDYPSPDPEMGEAFFRVGPYYSNSSFLFVDRIYLYIYYDPQP